MIRKIHPIGIGAFVLLACAIAVTAIVVLGSAKFLRQTSRSVIFFESSLSGLDVGAPVEYRGVRVGRVAEISIHYNARMSEVMIPVYVDIEDGRFKNAEPHTEHTIAYHIDQGLRAQLEAQSLLTGKMKVMLVDRPDSPKRLVGGDPDTIEIPAIPTLVENISQKIEKLPIVQIVSNLDITMKQIAGFTSSGELSNTVLRLSGALKELEELGRRMNKDMPGLLASARQNGDSFQQLQKSMDATLKEARDLLARESPERQQLVTTLQSLENTSNSLRNLLDYLQVHPEALISGKKEK
jgi:paraquat-inducible protein B